MKKTCILFSTLFAFYLLGQVGPQLTAHFSISTYGAKKIIDIIFKAGTIWSIIGIVAAIVGSGGLGVAALAAAKAIAKKFGKKAAIAW